MAPSRMAMGVSSAQIPGSSSSQRHLSHQDSSTRPDLRLSHLIWGATARTRPVPLEGSRCEHLRPAITVASANRSVMRQNPVHSARTTTSSANTKRFLPQSKPAAALEWPFDLLCARQDRTMMQLQETANELKDALSVQTQLIGQLMDRLQNIETTLGRTPTGQASPLASGHGPGSNANWPVVSNQSGSQMLSQSRTQSAQPNSLKRESSMPIHSTQSPTSFHNAPIKTEAPSYQARGSTTPVDHTQNYPLGTQSNTAKSREESRLKSGHITPAHRVLQDWPTMKGFCEGIPYFEDLKRQNIPIGDYPMKLELARGIVGVWGIGQGREKSMGSGMETVATPASQSSDASSPPAASPSVWGQGDVFSPTSMPLRGDTHCETDSPGGLGANGQLKLDEKTVRRLHASYMENIHVLQPILNPSHLRRSVNEFAQSYGPEARRSQPSVGFKRKRSRSIIDEFDTASEESTGPVSIHRSIRNAIVLLVLALGKVSEWKGPLPRPADGPFTGYTASDAVHVPTPPVHRSFSGDHGTADAWRRNIDILPGWAYYAFATDILGNQYLGLTVMHGQASVLAALYCAQFGRVLQSWKYINDACTVCTVLIKS